MSRVLEVFFWYLVRIFYIHENYFNSKVVFIFLIGIYDLVPLLKTDINENLKMNLNEAEHCSPLAKSKNFRMKKLRILKF